MNPPPSAALLLLLGTLAVVLAVVSLAHGAGGTSWDALPAVVSGTADQREHLVLVRLRLPRVLGAATAGALLAVAGALFQAVTRNALAEPSTLGVAPAAGAAVTVLLVLAGPQDAGGTAAAAVTGAVVGALVLGALAWSFGAGSRTLVLLGIAVATSFQALAALMLVQAGTGAQTALVWLTGSLGRVDLDRAVLGATSGAVVLLATAATGRVCDVLVLDEDSARAVGLSPATSRVALVAVATLATATAVGLAGVMAFVGLLAPHLARRALRTSRHAVLLPCAALTGSVLVLLADLLGRVLLAPVEIAAGVVVGLVGAPWFLLLVRAQR